MNSQSWQTYEQNADCRVLIVEDNPDVANMLSVALARGGYDVQTTRNGTEAIVVAASYKPHVMLVDIGLPGVDGLYVVREIRKTDRELLIIATTGRSTPEDIERSREAGCDHHLVKPIDLEALVAIVDDRVSRSGCGAA
jgi:DNA-binding response OmpR family regulator